MDHPLGFEWIDVQGLIKKHGLQPNKNLGQNFLIDPHYLNQVTDAGEIVDQDTVLEIGAGIGNLTRLLGTKARHVIAVEIDANLIPILREVTREYSNIEVIHGDILAIEISDLITSSTFQVIANIPYYITSKIIRYLMTGSIKPQRIILTIQNEVAERICALSGKQSLLSLGVQVFGHPTIESKIPAGAFFPIPKVDSAIVRIDMFPSPLVPAEYLETFFYLAKAGFSQKRKNLRNSLSAGTSLDKNSCEQLLQSTGIDYQRRSETLSIAEWQSLALEYQRIMFPQE
jgi:16S rRNA (adenine1518-N6/adenine1519-N6)-dimethyltransferase